MNPNPAIHITFLSTIAGPDFPLALQRQAALGLSRLDLKDGLWGQTIEQIDEATAQRAAALIQENQLSVDCFSTGIGQSELTNEGDFRAKFEPALNRALRSAQILPPRTFRLLPPKIQAEKGDAFAKVQRDFPWLMGVYREWVDRIDAAGFAPIIENEINHNLFFTPADIVGFFTALDRPAARYTYDVQNLWQSGTFPTLAVYQQLRPFIGALHLKGGRSEVPGGPIVHAAPLEEASWPVHEIVRAVITDAISPVICLNPSHGAQPPGWDIWDVAYRDLAYLRRNFPEIHQPPTPKA